MRLLTLFSEPRTSPSTPAPRVSRVPGMSFGHDLLLAVIMAIAMTATVFLYR